MAISEDDVFDTILSLAKPVVSLDVLRQRFPDNTALLRMHLGSLFRTERIMRQNGNPVLYWTSATDRQVKGLNVVATSVAEPTAVYVPETYVPPTRGASKKRPVPAEPEAVAVPAPAASDSSESEVAAQNDLGWNGLPATGPRGILHSTALTTKVARVLYLLSKIDAERYYTTSDIMQLCGNICSWIDLRRVLVALSALSRTGQAYLARQERRFVNKSYTDRERPFCYRWANDYSYPTRSLTSEDVRRDLLSFVELRQLLEVVPAPSLDYAPGHQVAQQQPPAVAAVPAAVTPAAATASTQTQVLESAVQRHIRLVHDCLLIEAQPFSLNLDHTSTNYVRQLLASALPVVAVVEPAGDTVEVDRNLLKQLIASAQLAINTSTYAVGSEWLWRDAVADVETAISMLPVQPA